jgi:hypothetical protein
MNDEWPRGDPRDVIRAIVADPRYVHATPAHPAQASWFDMLRDWLGALVRSLLHGIDRALGADNAFDSAIGFAVIAAALALLAWGSFILVRSYGRVPRRSTPAQAPIARGAAQSSAALRAAALSAARGQRYREAAALLFVSALRVLEERGRLAYDPARTPGEYRRLVRDPVFDALADDAVVAVFAAVEPSAELFERMHGTYERFLAAPAV